MISKPLFVHPFARLLIFLILPMGIFTAASLYGQLINYALLLLLLLASGQWLSHFRIVLIIGTPFLLLLFWVYGVLLEKPTSEITGIAYGIKVFTRVFSLTALFQFVFGLKAIELMDLLNQARIKGFLKLIFLEAYVTIDELNNTSNQILTARFSRGYVKKRTLWTQFRQFPYLLRPLLSGLLNGSFEKSANWKQLRLMEQLNASKRIIKNYPIGRSILLAGCCSLWVILQFFMSL